MRLIDGEKIKQASEIEVVEAKNPALAAAAAVPATAGAAGAACGG